MSSWPLCAQSPAARARNKPPPSVSLFSALRRSFCSDSAFRSANLSKGQAQGETDQDGTEAELVRNIFNPLVVSCPRSRAYGGVSRMNLAATHGTTVRIGIVCATLLAVSTLAPGARAEEWTKSYTVSGR